MLSVDIVLLLVSIVASAWAPARPILLSLIIIAIKKTKVKKLLKQNIALIQNNLNIFFKKQIARNVKRLYRAVAGQCRRKRLGARVANIIFPDINCNIKQR